MIIGAIIAAILWFILGTIFGIFFTGCTMKFWINNDEKSFDEWIKRLKEKANN